MDKRFLKVLEEIRDAVQDNSTRIDQTNTRLDQLENRVTSMDARVGTQLVGVAATLETVTKLFADRLDLRDRVERCETEIEELKRRP